VSSLPGAADEPPRARRVARLFSGAANVFDGTRNHCTTVPNLFDGTRNHCTTVPNVFDGARNYCTAVPLLAKKDC